jgi:hypothetical protein
MNLPIQRQGPGNAWDSHRVEAGNVQAKPASDARPGDASSTDQVFTGGFFVTAGDGTQKHALAQEAMASREAMASEIGGVMPAAADQVPTEAQPTPKEVAKEVARQEKSIGTFLSGVFGKAAGQVSHQVQKSLPKLVEKSVEFGLKRMTNMALQQMIPDMDPHVVKALSKDITKIALPVVVSTVVNVGMGMKSRIEGLLEWAAPPPSEAP